MALFWTDTHVHLYATEYHTDRQAVIDRATAAQVTSMIIPAINAASFATVRQLAHATKGAVYALGIHPLFVNTATQQDLEYLAKCLQKYRNDPKLIAVGEIGLDGFVTQSNIIEQQFFFHEQLKLAKQFDLPVIMHVRKAQDLILKGLRLYQPSSGIAHAFNGSLQQADEFVKLNFALGFGGAATFEKALQIRRVLQHIPKNAIVLETDSPDIAPAWLYKQRNEPAQIPQIAQCLANILNITLNEINAINQNNVARILPKLLPSNTD
jgi:TatD DNase family protein